ncbi:MAG: flagellar motor protein MotB [Cryobacterium sp.]|uniref:OmpA/MotB family protein n=1 Tax=unclassified Cryobacterium TaxID=2649013 RepID=UPI0018C9AD6F|nr:MULTISPECIES: flagellar motor protein MotB [unclassified Cryobacterium]MCY7404475.1 flagellar motor protein MotB [Cryobacterium sp.]MEC5153981.1 chemotaxis protein MotB [Cryobacterium sp. CAN_C3]
MSVRPRRRKKVEDEEVHPDERWMASYMDMVTVLMCMFIVLFAMSTVDQAKFEKLANSLASGFGTVEAGKIDTAEGVVVPADKINDVAEGFIDTALTNTALTDAASAREEVRTLKSIEDQVNANLSAAGMTDRISFTIDERGLTMGLVGSESFFAPDSTALSAVATSVLDAAAPVLAAANRQISVEGHADKHGQSAIFATDWELSSGRATQVLRRLVEQGGVTPGLIGAVGYGSARPASTGSTLADMAQNRRVDIVLLSDKSDGVRALIPAALEADGTSVATTP